MSVLPFLSRRSPLRRVLPVPYVGTDTYETGTCQATGRAGLYRMHVREPSFVRLGVETAGSPAATVHLNDYALRGRLMGFADRSVRALLLPGIYEMRAGDSDRTSAAPMQVTLRTEAVPEAVTGCEQLWLPFEALSTEQSWSATDCTGPVPGVEPSVARTYDEFRFDIQSLASIPPVEIEAETAASGELRLVLAGDKFELQPDGGTVPVEVPITSVTATNGRVVLARQLDYAFVRHTLRVVAPVGTAASYQLRIRVMPGPGIPR